MNWRPNLRERPSQGAPPKFPAPTALMVGWAQDGAAVHLQPPAPRPPPPVLRPAPEVAAVRCSGPLSSAVWDSDCAVAAYCRENPVELRLLNPLQARTGRC